MDNTSKILILLGSILILFGIIWHFSGGNIPLGKLPGDIRYKSENGSFYFPLTSCLIISILVSIISYFFKK
jgi:hypothetical protein